MNSKAIEFFEYTIVLAMRQILSSNSFEVTDELSLILIKLKLFKDHRPTQIL